MRDKDEGMVSELFGISPALPDQMEGIGDIKGMELPIIKQLNYLQNGCYMLKVAFSNNPFGVYDGTLRVFRKNFHTPASASGDLYRRGVKWVCLKWPKICIPVLQPDPSPSGGVPIFPRNQYAYYLKVTKLPGMLFIGNSFTLGFEMHRFNKTLKSWANEGSFTALMTIASAPAGYPSGSSFYEGDLKNSAGTVVGKISMGRVSHFLRRAIVELDRVSQSEAPVHNGSAENWQTIFERVGWDVRIVQSDANVNEPSGEGWSDGECHDGMLKWRNVADLDTQWLYHLLCVRKLDSTERGIMYDAYGGDSNNIPREGAAIASHWYFGNDNLWGKCKGMRFGAATAPYFRTAVHEIGHAMMMFHPYSSLQNHIMQVTPSIAGNAVPPVQFPDNIIWDFSPEDADMLRHLPDVVVRPGTVLRFGQDVGSNYTGIPLDDYLEVEGLHVEVSPLLGVLPLGAPVRVNFRLKNTNSFSMQVPRRLDMKGGHVTGKVIDPSGTERTFSTIVRYLDEDEMMILEPGKEVSESLTLLRGPKGGLFPMPGMYRVEVLITWDAGGNPVRCTGETHCMVTPPQNEAHAKAAFRVLKTPDTLVTMVLGGDHLAEGIEAISGALKDTVLRPHYAYIEAKRIAQHFGKRKAKVTEAARLISDETVMSHSEINKAIKLFESESEQNEQVKQVVQKLRLRLEILPAGQVN